MRNETENKYWVSLEQLENDPVFLEKANQEFISTPLREGEESGISRRDFVKLVAAGSALASSGCFKRPVEKILPYVNQPEEIVLGVPNYYASTCQECSAGCGTLVKTREGRPIKLEGNPEHPMNQGGLCARGQAGILSLYDPDRMKAPHKNSRGSRNFSEVSWEAADAEILAKLKSAKNVRILSSTLTSPATKSLIKGFLGEFSNGKHVTFDPISNELVREGQKRSYGVDVLPRYLFEKAQVIVSLDADFLGTWLSPVEFTKKYAPNRKVSESKKWMSKLVSFESSFSLTGANADERYPVRAEEMVQVAYGLISEVAKLGARVSAEDLKAARSVSSEGTGVSHEVLAQLAKELYEKRGKSLVVAGSPQSQNANGLALQLAVNVLNSALQNDGATIDHSVSPSNQSQSSYEDLTTLISEMKSGSVDALLIFGSNPSFHLSDGLSFKEAAAKVGLVLSFNDRADETAELCDFVLPVHHSLENWGDAEPQKDLFSLVQPTIRPVYNTRSFQDSLISFSGGKLGKNWFSYLQNYWKDSIYKRFDVSVTFKSFWENSLRDGFFDGVKYRGDRFKSVGERSLKSVLSSTPLQGASSQGFDLVFYPQIAMFDGSGANNPWLQELSDPVTRICWDNYASLSPATAQKLGIKSSDVIRVEVGGQSLDIAAHVQPGLHDKTVAIALGYGRTKAGKIAEDLVEKVGLNGFKFVGPKNGFVTTGALLRKTGVKYRLAAIQDHHVMEGRAIVKEAPLSEYVKDPAAGNEKEGELTTLWSGHKYEGYRWGMNIDLNSCTGCNACVIGCQSENNISVVGKDGIARGRTMAWMRIDRYYTGTPDRPKVVYQPMLCQHCENAPCETVCPVIATAHSDEGLNQQIYNRCVGTRYCANNCPYKVRRFNWFEYNYDGDVRYPQNLATNPEVTPRSRGVMEKCSFCIQRIHEAKNKAKDLGRTVIDGEMKTACQQSCPADAISFGNINDTEAQVTKLNKDPRSYHVLEELNVRPSVTYLTKIRNTETTENEHNHDHAGT